MGIDLQLYRARIGAHAFRASCRDRPRPRDSLTDVHLCAAICIVAIVTGLMSGLIVHAFATSHCVVGLTSAINGQLPLTAVSPSVDQTISTMSVLIDLSDMIILCGDVETNPGPSYIDEEKLEKLLSKMEQSIKDEMEEMRGDIRMLTRKLESFEDAFRKLRDSVQSHESHLERMDTALNELANRMDDVESRLVVTTSSCTAFPRPTTKKSRKERKFSCPL